MFSPPGPDRDGVEGEEAEGEPEGKGEPPRGVIGVLGSGLVSLIRGDGRDILYKVVYNRQIDWRKDKKQAKKAGTCSRTSDK